jgi:hypothetical protein
MTRLLLETDDAGDTERAYTATIQEYGDLVSEYDESSGQSAFHQYDALGSTDALLDADETATDRYQYRAFGLATHETGTSDSPFTFVGKQNYYRDPELELYYLGMGNPSGGGRPYGGGKGVRGRKRWGGKGVRNRFWTVRINYSTLPVDISTTCG